MMERKELPAEEFNNSPPSFSTESCASERSDSEAVLEAEFPEACLERSRNFCQSMSPVSSSIMVRSKTCLPYAVRGDNARKRAVGAATSYMFAPVLTAQKSSVVNDRMTKTMYGGKLNLY